MVHAFQTVSETEKVLRPVVFWSAFGEARKHVFKGLAVENLIDQVLAIVGRHVVGDFGAAVE